MSGGRQRGFPWLAVLGSLALVVVLVVGVAVVLVLDRDDDAPGDERDGGTSAEAARERLLGDGRTVLPTTASAQEAVPGFDYTAPVDGAAIDEDLVIPARYDAEAEDLWKGDPGRIEVYADQGLTRHVPFDILPDLTASDDDPRLALKPLRVRSTHIVREGGQVGAKPTWTLADVGTYWSLNPRVYVVQYLEPDGAQRARPLVTEVHFASETPAPEQVTASVTGQGDALLEWSPVAGATEYAVVVQRRTGDTLNGSVQVVGRTTKTSWSSEEVRQCHGSTCDQNEVLKLTTGDASLMASTPELVSDDVEVQLGVVAVVDRQPSVLAPVDLAGLEALPVRSDDGWDAGADVANDGLAGLPSRFLFVSVDGSTRATGAYVERGEVRRQGRIWLVPVRGRGTRLSHVVRIPADAVDNIDADVRAFNTRAQRAYPKAGLGQTKVVIDVNHPKRPAPELPAPDLPVFGSNELSRFIAGQLVAGSTSIDLSRFEGKPGLPGFQDALDEAILQNPYALATFDEFSFDGSVLYVDPAFDAAELRVRQRSIADAAERIAKDETRPGMSVSDKVAAINRYLVDQADYDHVALAAAEKARARDKETPKRFQYAWTVDGILLDRSGVCMSYSFAFQAIAKEAGIESVIVTGDLANGGRHAWNKVKDGRSWRSVDVTWNDPGGPWRSGDGTRYLMIRDGQFTGNALRSEDDAWMADAYLRQYATR
jgi:hypothetical protein